MGMTTMFSNSADFSNLLDSPEPLQVSDVIHKAFIEVNEDGAEAAAATGKLIFTNFFDRCYNHKNCIFILSQIKKKAVLTRCKRALSENRFEADHPFMFVLLSRSSKIQLFSGSVRSLESSIISSPRDEF